MILTTQPFAESSIQADEWGRLIQQHGFQTVVAAFLIWVFVKMFTRLAARTQELEDRQHKLTTEVLGKNTSALERVASALEHFNERNR